MVRDSTILFAVFGAVVIAFTFMWTKAHEAEPTVPGLPEEYHIALWLLGLTGLGFFIGAFKSADTERNK
ncbi:MAG: hypothetical protein KY455_13355 [Euryarchaeota archaeon]|nr:hypothetical protein [Euryarchaeota archaeon]